jgi:hypothetical protein
MVNAVLICFFVLSGNFITCVWFNNVSLLQIYVLFYKYVFSFFAEFLVGSISCTASVEMRTSCTIKHNPSLLYSSVINVLVYQNSHQAPLL